MGGSVRRSRLPSLLTRTGEEATLECRRCRIVDGRNHDALGQQRCDRRSSCVGRPYVALLLCLWVVWRGLAWLHPVCF